MTANARSLVIRITISIAAVFLLIFLMRDKLSNSLAMIRHGLDMRWFLCVVAGYVVGNAILAVRMRSVFRAQEVHMSVREAIHLTIVGLFFNLFLPSAVGGDMAKVYYACQYSGKKMESTTSIILDRMIGFVSIICMAVAAVFICKDQFGDAKIDRLIFLFLGLMLLAVAFFASKRFARVFSFFKIFVPSEKWRKRLSEVYHSIHGYRNHLPILMYSLALSFFAQGIFTLTYYWTALSLGHPTNPWLYFLFVPALAIVSMVPSIGGLGVREAGSVYFFSRLMPTETALALSLLMDFIIYGFSLIAGLWYAFHGGLKAKLPFGGLEEIDHAR